MKIDTGYNTDEPQKPYAKWKKPDAKKKEKKSHMIPITQNVQNG